MDCSAILYYLSYFDEWAGLPRGTLKAIAQKESSFNPADCSFRNVCNWVGACGLMQLRKNALADIKRVYGIDLDPLNPIHAIVGAAALFNINRQYLMHFTGQEPDVWALIVSYNGGYQAGLRYMRFQPLVAESKNYLFSVYNNLNPYA